MNPLGYSLVVFGILSMIGAFSAGKNPSGGIFCCGLEIYIISRKKKSEARSRDKEKWANGEKNEEERFEEGEKI